MDYVNVKALHLKAALKKEGKTMRHFNERLGKNRSFLSNVLTGSEKITRDELQVVADGLGTTVEYLMGETNDSRLPEEIEAAQNHRVSVVDLFAKTAPLATSSNLPGPSKIPEEWGLGQKTSEEVAEEAELMRLYGKLTAEDKKTVLDLMRRLNNP
jgi:transcriptional regulator with XRE-family HTH domain